MIPNNPDHFCLKPSRVKEMYEIMWTISIRKKVISRNLHNKVHQFRERFQHCHIIDWQISLKLLELGDRFCTLNTSHNPSHQTAQHPANFTSHRQLNTTLHISIYTEIYTLHYTFHFTLKRTYHTACLTEQRKL